MFGKVVRDTWVKWAIQKENPKPSHLIPWEELDEDNKEVDELIGKAIFEFINSKYINIEIEIKKLIEEMEDSDYPGQEMPVCECIDILKNLIKS